MPIIKDKYGGKGSQTRSKYLTRDKNKAFTNPPILENTTEQKKEILKNNYREDAQNINEITNTTRAITSQNILPTSETTQVLRSVGSFKITRHDEALRFFTLRRGGSLHSLILNNFNSDASTETISVYWGVGDQDSISFTVSSGVVTSTSGGDVACLFSSSFTGNTSIDLSSTVNALYKHVNQDIVFYVVCSDKEATVSFSFSNG